ncbi:class I SAM-dependent methyltransferase [Williamsia sp. MIQD14]|uniref:class I SAM-dependent methyltransferase n=1 Tax=Williamsia sp. MIQD14 TaxID=3425703 RepID=UPI003D9FD8FB
MDRNTLPFLRVAARTRLRERKLRRILGPDLSRPVSWQATDNPLVGETAEIFELSHDVHKWSQYFEAYDAVLAPLRDRPIRMLEIGVFRGGSLEMWRTYLHPDSVIVGVDIDPDCARFDDPDRDIHVRIGPQQDTAFLRRVIDEFGPFDVILDDGSHVNSHIIDSFTYLFPNALADNGTYMVEDIHANYWWTHADRSETFVDLTKWLIDAMHAHYFDNIGESAFHAGGAERKQVVRVPFATTIVGKIEFYDSVAVIHRRIRELPRSIFRA